VRRRLLPDALRDILTKCTAKDASWQEVDLLKDHLEALEAEIAELSGRSMTCIWPGCKMTATEPGSWCFEHAHMGAP
jgi:hypothetical protein